MLDRLARFDRKREVRVCTNCGVVNTPDTRPGSVMDLLLALNPFMWLASILSPGAGRVCESCGQAGTLVPVDTPRGRQLAAEAGYAGPSVVDAERPWPERFGASLNRFNASLRRVTFGRFDKLGDHLFGPLNRWRLRK